MIQGGQTLTERTRALLLTDTSAEFTVSRTALETLLADSERYGELSAAVTQSLLNARSNLARGSHAHDGRIVWEQVIAQLERLSCANGSVTRSQSERVSRLEEALKRIDGFLWAINGTRSKGAMIAALNDIERTIKPLIAALNDGGSDAG